MTLSSGSFGGSVIALYNPSGAFREEIGIDDSPVGVFNLDGQILIVTKNTVTGDISFNPLTAFFD